MSRRSLALCLVLAVGGLGAALAWFATRDGDGREPVPSVERGPSTTAGPREPAEALVGTVPGDGEEAGAPSSAPDAIVADPREAIPAAPSTLPRATDEPTEPATLHLRVTDEAAVAVARYEVQLFVHDKRREEGDAWRKVLTQDVDDTDGSASFDVHAGVWRVLLRAEGYIAREEQSEWTHGTVELPSPSVLPIVLRRAASLSGRVVDTSRRPVQGAEVLVLETADNPFAGDDAVGPPAKSDAEGRFELSMLSPGQRSVTARAEGFAPCPPVDVSLIGGEDTPVEFVLTQGGTLYGEVLLDGRPAPNGRVVAFSTDARQVRETETDALGGFEIAGLTPGEYHVIAGTKESGGEEGLEFALATVVDGERTHVVIGAREEGAVLVHGLVVRAGVPVATGDVIAIREDSRLMSGFALAKVGEDGRFELEVAGPGAYVFFADDAFLEHVDVPAGPELSVTIEISEGSIGGQVRGPAGPVPHARVGLRAASPLLALRGSVWREADGDGRYVFDELPPGGYSVTAGGAEAGLGRTTIEGLELAPGAVIDDAHIDLGPGARISGSVVDGHGRPMAGVHVLVQDARGALLHAAEEIETDGAGRFTTGYLGGDVATLVARSPTGVSRSETAPLTGGTGEVVLRIAAAGARVEIVCRDAEGRALRATVALRDEHGFDHANLPETNDARLFEKGISRSTFAFEPLPPGRFTAEARTEEGRSARVDVVLEAGDERRVELVLD